MKRWFTLGKKLLVPSLRVATVSLQPKHYVDGTVVELDKIIGNVSPDSSRLQFWKIDKRTPEYVSIGENISTEDRHLKRKVIEDMATFDGHKIELLNMEKKDESEYPEKVLKIFRTKEHFQPFKPSAVCVMIVHNVTHWKNCMDSAKSIDSTFHATEVMKSLYKFPPMSSDMSCLFDDRTSLSSERSRNPSKTGHLGLLREYSEDENSTLIHRQRFLLITVLKSSINFFFYNWSKESSDRLVEHAKLLGSWTQSRIQVLSSILLQKSGLYYNQPIFRSESSALALGHIDIKDLILNPSPPKNLQLTTERFQGRKSITSKPNFQMSDVYRNLRHYGSRMPQEAILKDPVLTYGKKTITMLDNGKKETENALFRNWLSRGPSASNVIGMEAIEAFKHASRTIHYCMTPIIFLPRWRNSVALTRDSSVGVYKRVGDKRSQDVQKLRLGLLKDSESKLKYPIWSIWKRAQFSYSEEDGNSSPTLLKEKREEDSWHNALCNSFLQEFMQYLQTLGFIPTHTNGGTLKRRQPVLTSENWSASYVGRLGRIRRMSDGSVLSVESDGNFSSVASPSKPQRNGRSKVEEEDGVFYLQKSLPGGIILLEVGLSEPFCYCKIHALEANRIQQNKSSGRMAASHSTLTFMDECDKMKVLMHLHSFAYDFHLRCLHSNITGRQLMLKQGYHVTKFLDDFICYYCKGPNFARNTIHLGILTVQNVSTPSHILFNYILTHDKVYQMKVIRMTPLYSASSLELSHEYILVYSLSKKVVYKELEDENHTEEFDMSLLISHDTPFCPAKPYSIDPSVLRLKYYVILTSRRELYPKVIPETNFGKLCPVTAPKPLLGEPDRLSAHFVNLHSGSELSEHEMTVSATESSTDVHVQPKEPSLSQLETGPDGIREENILYMGYFSSHEQMMQQIVKEQTAWADNFIKNVVGNAAVDCRRDLLWQRLLVGDKNKHLKEDLTIRETVGVLTYWEFSELLELVWVQPLQKMDSRLQTLLQQPISFFQTLIKLLTYGRQYQHRYFVSPDGSIHQLAIINPNMYKSIVVAEMNTEQRTCDLNLVFKESIGDVTSLPLDIDVEIISLVETAVGACCYCNWINFL